MLLVAMAGLAACGQGQVDVWLGFPEVGTGETLVLLHGPFDDRQVEVVEPGGDPSAFVIQADEGDLDPVAMTFAARARDVALPSGSLAVVAPAEGRLLFGAPSAFFTEPPIGVFSLQRRRSPASAAWRALAPIPSELAALAVPFEPRSCPAFDQPRWSRSLTSFVSAVVRRIDDDHAVVIARGASSADGRWVASPVGLSAAGSGERVSAVVEVDDAWWMADRLGQWYRAEPDRATGWRNKVPLAVPELGRAILGFTTSGTTADVFAGTTEPAVLHYDGRAWTSLGRARLRAGMIVSTGPESALLVDDDGRLSSATPDGLREVVNAPKALHSLQLVEGLGPVVGDELGTFYAEEGDEWVQVVPRRFGWFGLSAIDYEGGLVFLLASGLGGFYSPAAQLCEDLFATRFLNAGRVMRMGDGLFVAGEVGSAPQIDLIWVPRR